MWECQANELYIKKILLDHTPCHWPIWSPYANTILYLTSSNPLNFSFRSSKIPNVGPYSSCQNISLYSTDREDTDHTICYDNILKRLCLQSKPCLIRLYLNCNWNHNQATQTLGNISLPAQYLQSTHSDSFLDQCWQRWRVCQGTSWCILPLSAAHTAGKSAGSSCGTALAMNGKQGGIEKEKTLKTS